VTQDLSARLHRVEQQIRAFSKLHASELQLILDELTDISKQLEEEKAAARASEASADAPSQVDPSDPAASSPKRAKWLAEQERKAAPKSRRELLFGERDEKP
jgi:phage shock protein A